MMIWHPFDRESYCYEWKRKKLIGILVELRRDIKFSIQRIRNGYCDPDAWAINDWFLGIMPAMLQELKDTRSSSPPTEDYIAHAMIVDDKDRQDEVHVAWDAVLERMIFLMKEADERTCSQENPYADEHLEILTQSMQNKKDELGNVHTRYEIADENQLLEKKYRQEEMRLAEYRKNCKDEALVLFSKWFYQLWD